jgi:hypothetical protein
VLTILLALAFSLAVCAVIGFGATTIMNHLVAFVQQQRDRFRVTPGDQRRPVSDGLLGQVRDLRQRVMQRRSVQEG